MVKVYDIIIIGGGIAGLNIAYELSKQHNKPRVLLLESLHKLGGRVYTYNSNSCNNTSIEAGAGRFNKSHKRLFGLIKELNLEENIKSIGKAHLKHISHERASPAQNLDVNIFIKRIITGAKTIPEKTLREQNIITLVKKTNILSEDELDDLIGFYGYYSELELMNAYDAIELFKNGTNPDKEFFVMKGGLSQIISKMEYEVEKAENIRILKNKKVFNVLRRRRPRCDLKNGVLGGGAASNHEIIVKCQDGIEYICEKCIFALPKPCFEKFSIVRDAAADNVDFRRSIDSVICAPLCRIYSYYDNTRNAWIKEQIYDRFGRTKLTTNNMLRFLIPINDNIIMTSYTDNVFAEWWKEKYDNGGIVSINNQITWQLRDIFNTKSIPVANKTSIFYWDCGVGYWKVGANSKEAAKIVLNGGGRNVFICGENYSEKYQQWIEGALETSEKVLSILLRHSSRNFAESKT